MEIKLMDILVYNRSPEAFNKYWNDKYEKQFRRPDTTDDEWKEKLSILKDINRPATNWKFQNVIGYISIFVHGYSVFATLSIDVREKKYIEGKTDIRYDPSTFFKINVSSDMSSEDILADFNQTMQRALKERLPNRYIDLEAWNNTSKLIDWRKFFYDEEIHK